MLPVARSPVQFRSSLAGHLPRCNLYGLSHTRFKRPMKPLVGGPGLKQNCIKLRAHPPCGLERSARP